MIAEARTSECREAFEEWAASERLRLDAGPSQQWRHRFGQPCMSTAILIRFLVIGGI